MLFVNINAIYYPDGTPSPALSRGQHPNSIRPSSAPSARTNLFTISEMCAQGIISSSRTALRTRSKSIPFALHQVPRRSHLPILPSEYPHVVYVACCSLSFPFLDLRLHDAAVLLCSKPPARIFGVAQLTCLLPLFQASTTSTFKSILPSMLGRRSSKP